MSLALLGGVLIAEGLFVLQSVLQLRSAGCVELGAGILAPLVLGRSLKDRLLGFLGYRPPFCSAWPPTRSSSGPTSGF